ncbi:hypothetical protein V3C33_14175 [Micrococcaceae bacterium Sec5.7]
MAQITGRKKRIIITTAAMLALGGGAAFAYWSATGAATGAAGTGTSVPFTVTTAGATGDPLTPGGPTQTVGFTVKNPGSGSQNLSSVVVTVANSDGTQWTAAAGCSAADYTVGTPVVTTGQIAAGADVPGTVTITMKNLATNQDGCKGQSVPLYVAAR